MRTRLIMLMVLAGLSVAGRAAAATDFPITNNGMSAWRIGGVDNPTLTFTRGQTYTFTIDPLAFGHPLWITTARGAEDAPTNAWALGVTNNGGSAGTTVTFVVPASAPSTLFYQCSFHGPMVGTLNIVSAAATVPSIGLAASAVLAALLLLVAVAILRRRART